MPRKQIDHGETVVNGKLRRCSVTMVERANTSTQGCLRALFYRYVLGWKEPIKLDKKTGLPVKQGKDVGGDCHNEIEHYLTTGDMVLGRITAAARRYMPAPKSIGVTVEMNIGGTKGDLTDTVLEIEGVPFVGYIDIIDRRGQYLTEDGEGFYHDPLNTTEVLDWKFGATAIDSEKEVCYAKKGSDLRLDTQMMTYGLVPFTLWPDSTDWVRLSHVYTNTKNTPRSSKASTLVNFDALDAHAQHTGAIVRVIKDVVAEVDPEKVPGNSYACLSFGGCPFIENCSHWKQSGGLESFYGSTETDRLLEGEINMGILEGISLPGMPGNPPVTASPTGVAATIPLVPQMQASSHDVLSQIAQVANTPAQPSAPAWQPAFPTAEFNTAVTMIEQKGYGLVGLTGAAAQMYLALRGDKRQITPESTVQGYGVLGAKTVDDPAVVLAISRDLGAHPNNPKPDVRPEGQLMLHGPIAAPAVLGILSPIAPQSNPQLAADPVPGFVPQNAITPNVQIPGLMASVPPAASAAIVANTATAPTDTGIPPEKTKRQYNRKPKTDTAGAASTNANDSAGYPAQSVATGGGSDGLWLFVNARPNINVIDLIGWIVKLCDDIAKHHQLIVPDIRTAKGDHPLAFFAWKGHLAAYTRACAGKLEPGAYYLRLGTDIAECVLEGLRAAKRPNPDGTESLDPVFELITFGE